MGLLDMLQGEGGMRLGLGLLAAGGPTTDPNKTGLGARLQQGIGYYDDFKKEQEMARRAKLQEEFQAFQMEQAKAQMAQQAKAREQSSIDDAAVRGAFSPMDGGRAMSNGQGPTLENAQNIGKMQAFDPRTFLTNNPQASLGALKQAMETNKAINPEEEFDFQTVGDNLVRTSKRGTAAPVFTAAPKPAELPTAVREFQFAQTNPEFTPWMLQGKRAGANSQTVNVAAPENKFNQDIGAGLAKDALALVDVARNASGTVATAQSIRNALASGAITGTGADIRLGVQKALETAGLVGEGKAASTQELMAGLSKITLSGIKTSGLGGGAGFTDKDKVFLESAISGTIADTPENLRRVADLSEKIARASHQKGNQVLGRWQKNPALAGFAQDITIDDIPQAQAPTANKPNLINELPKTAPVGARARDTTTGKIMVFDGMKWKDQ